MSRTIAWFVVLAIAAGAPAWAQDGTLTVGSSTDPSVAVVPINLSLAPGVGVGGFDVTVRYDASIITPTGFTDGDWFTENGTKSVFVVRRDVFPSLNLCRYAAVLLGAPPTYGSGTLFSIIFGVVAPGTSPILVRNCEWSYLGTPAVRPEIVVYRPGSTSTAMAEVILEQGMFSNVGATTAPQRDLAILAFNVTSASTSYGPGIPCTATITIQNQGDTTSAFSLEMSQTGYLIGGSRVTTSVLAPGAVQFLTLPVTPLSFSSATTPWHAHAWYPGIGSGMEAADPGEWDTRDNGANTTLVLGAASATIDVAVSNLTAPDAADPGDVVTLAADVANLGNGALAGVVDFKVDGTIVGQASFYTLAPGASARVSAHWDTTGWAGGDHRIAAMVRQLPGELVVVNNVVERMIALSGAITPAPPADDDEKSSCSASVPSGAAPLAAAFILALAGCMARRRP